MKTIEPITFFILCSLAVTSWAQSHHNGADIRKKAFEDTMAIVLHKRSVPAPDLGSVSKEMRNAIIAKPPPNYEDLQNYPKTDAEWKTLVNANDLNVGIAAMKMAEAWSIKVEKTEINGVTVRYVTPMEIDKDFEHAYFVHIHGGAFIINGGDASIAEAVVLAQFLKIPVISIDYRMPPEFPFPHGLNDVLAAFEGIKKKYPNHTLFMGGSSAGAGLTMSTIIKIKAKGGIMPEALFLGTPASDVSKTGDSFYINEGIDKNLGTWDGLVTAAIDLYANGIDLGDQYISPIHGDLTGFPPTILISGTRDLLLSNTVRAHRKLRDSGVETDLVVLEGQSHADYAIIFNAPESQAALSDIGAFFKRQLPNK
jgi:acetyl esterase/lipase